jgi:hypothetical protein
VTRNVVSGVAPFGAVTIAVDVRKYWPGRHCPLLHDARLRLADKFTPKFGPLSPQFVTSPTRYQRNIFVEFVEFVAFVA